MEWSKIFLNEFKILRGLVSPRRVQAGVAIVLTACLATPLWASPFFFTTGTPNGSLAALSRRPSPGKIETETADDFTLSETTVIKSATITGLIPAGASLESIKDIEVEVYHVFPKDSDIQRIIQVPSRANSPADVEIATATRAKSQGSISFSVRPIDPNFTVGATVVNNVRAGAGAEPSFTGKEVEITIKFRTPIILPAGDYFFRPEVVTNSGDFLYLSGQRPIPGSPLLLDRQAWIRNSNLNPDWLRIGTDIIGGTVPPTFNMSFSLSGETIPDAGTPGLNNCQGQSIAAIIQQFGNIDVATSSLGFSTARALQNGFTLFCD